MKRDVVGVGVLAFGIYHLALGLYMVVAPGSFFDQVGPFGVRNDHYIADVATFELAFGAGLVAAQRLRSWMAHYNERWAHPYRWTYAGTPLLRDTPFEQTRTLFIDTSTAYGRNVRTASFDVLIVEFAQRMGARTIVKGLRAISDFEYEMEMNQLNRMQAPDIDTLYLMASPQYSFLSSSGVKELAMFDGQIDDLVPERVARRLKEELAR